MTQSATAPPKAAPAPTPHATSAQAASSKRRFWPAPTGKPVGAGVEDTPTLLNRLQLIGMATVLVFGLLSGLVQFLSYQSDGRAADDTEQLVRVQEIQSTLLELDAVATNLVLVGGEGDRDREAQYDEALTEILEQIAAAADAQSADELALAALNVEVNDYATSIAGARANIRQGFPVGKEYVRGASAELRAGALPILGNLVDANTERAEESMAGQHPFWLLLIGVVATAVLVWISMVLARRFRRYVNVGLAVAAVIVMITTLVAAIAAWRADSQNDNLLDNELKVAVDQASARTAGNDAKANESLRLINRGSGSTYEDPWVAAAAIVDDKADPSILDDWNAYVDAHAEIVRNDARDLRGPAIKIATSDADAPTNKKTGEPFDSTMAFDAFDKAAQQLVDENGTTTTDELRAGRWLALVGSLLTLAFGVVASVAVARGIGSRRKEYA